MLVFPRDWVAIRRGFVTKGHKGVDLMWATAQGGANAPIYAMDDGVVLAVVDGLGNLPNSNSYGNCINISHENKIYSFYAHLLSGSLTVKVGDSVKRGQVIAKMGNSGNSNGNHLHFELRKGGSSNAYVVDPLQYIYLDTSWQSVNADTAKNYNIKIYSEPRSIGTPVLRDTNRNQVELLSKVRNGRDRPTLAGNRLGYVKPGIYNILSKSESDNYVWFRIEENLYFANFPDDLLLYAEGNITGEDVDTGNLGDKLLELRALIDETLGLLSEGEHS